MHRLVGLGEAGTADIGSPSELETQQDRLTGGQPAVSHPRRSGVIVQALEQLR